MIERIFSMFQTVQNEGHGSVLLVFIIGMVFGSIIQYTKVHKFEKIAGFAMLKDTVVPKMLFLAIGLASIGLYFMIQLGWASYHIKPIILGGLIIGGTIFGASMAIFGKCPGTGPVSVAEGRVDIMVGALGGIFGGLVFTLFYDKLKLLMGPDLGKLTLTGYFEDHQGLAVLIFGLLLVAISIAIPLLEETDEDDIGYQN
ncbi:MAG: YeeE/YedE family protein [Sulfurimonas sp.]|nr:YeeE/YedE family protein [Sulfurimonas sp.]